MCSNFASALLLRFVYTPILDGRTKTLGIANFTVDSIVWLITEDYVNITRYLFYVSVQPDECLVIRHRECSDKRKDIVFVSSPCFNNIPPNPSLCIMINVEVNIILICRPCIHSSETAWARQKSCLISYMHGWVACTWHNNLWK